MLYEVITTKPLGSMKLAQKTIRTLVKKIFEGSFPLPPRQFLNVNIPPELEEAPLHVTYAGYRYYGNDAHLHRNPRGLEYYWLGLHVITSYSIHYTKLYEIDGVFGWMGDVVGATIANDDIRSLVVDGIIAGVGAVVLFVPNIVILFIGIALLESTGYMARVAFFV